MDAQADIMNRNNPPNPIANGWDCDDNLTKRSSVVRSEIDSIARLTNCYNLNFRGSRSRKTRVDVKKITPKICAIIWSKKDVHLEDTPAKDPLSEYGIHFITNITDLHFDRYKIDQTTGRVHA